MPVRKRSNDWLNGRKKMTAEQALRIVEFLKKERERPAKTALC